MGLWLVDDSTQTLCLSRFDCREARRNQRYEGVLRPNHLGKVGVDSMTDKLPQEPAAQGRVISRVAGFGIAPLMALAAPFLVLPAVAQVATPQQWAAFAVGQSAGVIVSVIATFGWSLRGAIEAVAVDKDELRRLWSEFLITCGLLTVVVNVASYPALALAAPPDTVGLSFAVSIATSLFGLAPNWYAIATGQPSIMVIYSAAPKIVAAVIATIVIAVSKEPIWYAPIVAVGCLAGVAVFTTKIARFVRITIADVVARLRLNSASALATAADALYSGGFLVFAGIFLPPDQLPSLASMDRLFRFAKQGLTALTSGLQSWVIFPREDRHRRQSVSLAWHGAAGAIGFIGFATLGPWATKLLFGSVLAAGSATALWYAAAFVVISVSSALAKHVMMVNGSDWAVFWSCAVGVGVALTMVPAVGSTNAATAAFVYFTIEISVLLFRCLQTSVAARRSKGMN